MTLIEYNEATDRWTFLDPALRQRHPGEVPLMSWSTQDLLANWGRLFEAGILGITLVRFSNEMVVILPGSPP